MQPQPLERRLERLEARVTILEQLPAKVDDLASQISQLRTEMRDEFSAVRDEMRGEFSAVRDEIRAGDEETRRVLHVIGDQILSQARTLYEDMTAKLALTKEGRSSSSKSRSRKRERS